MADRGAQAAVQDALAYDVDAFEHVVEAFGDFGSTFTEHSPTVAESAFVTYGEVFGHVVDDPEDLPVDWGGDHAAHVGDGWYMTEPVTGLIKLQGLANGHADVDGTLEMLLGLTATSAGVASIPPPALLKAVALEGQSAGHAATSPILRNVKALEAAAAGAATVTASLRILGAYREAVLVDSPYLYAHLDETTGSTLYNDLALGGAAMGLYLGSYTHAALGLVETMPARAARANNNFSSMELRTTWEALPDPTLEFALEFWIQTTNTGGHGIFQAFTDVLANELFLAGDLESNSSGGVLSFNHGHDSSMGHVEVVGVTRVNDGAPHHVVVVHEAGVGGKGVLSLYIDGRLDGSSIAATARSTDDFGAWYFGGQPGLFALNPGYLDEWAMYDHALTDEQVAEHYMAAWFDSRMVSALHGGATVTGALGLGRSLDGTSAGRAAMGDPTKNQVRFDSLTLPPGTTYSTAPSFVERSDSVAGTLFALRQADIDDSEVTYTDIPLDLPVASNITVRYLIDSEPGFDFMRLFLDGVQFKADSGTPGVFRVATVAASAAGHVLRIQYSKDSSADDGVDNVDVSQIVYGLTGVELDVASLGVVTLAGAAHGLAVMIGALDVSRPVISGRIGVTPVRRAFS